MNDFISIENLNKVYSNGFKALNNLNLKIKKGEIFGLLGPNGAGKSTLINIICGIVNPTSGKILVNNFDIKKDYRKTRSMIGIVPQELTVEAFETVINNVSYSRGLYGKKSDPKYIQTLLKTLSLWDKKDNRLRELSGGMKRRLLIAKALSHKPEILFLDEPSASVDVNLRKEMWKIIQELKNNGVTIILTTHYIEEAEEIADRIAIINNGEIIKVDDKSELIKKMGQKKLIIELNNNLNELPKKLDKFNLILDKQNKKITYIYDTKNENLEITSLLQILRENEIKFKDINTEQSSLENIFIDLLKGNEK